VASTAASAWHSDLLLEADDATATSEVQLSVPIESRGADRSREVCRRGGGAEFGATRRAPEKAPVLAIRGRVSGSFGVQLHVRGHVMRLILVWAGLLAATASPWWSLSGEPRPKCATRPSVASTAASAWHSDLLLEAVDATAT
jgi:hypothetical protein